MTKKVFLILLAIALALSVGLVACGGGEQEEEEEEEEEPPHEPFVMEFAAGTVGGSGYIIGYGLQCALRDHHPWLRALVTTLRATEAVSQFVNMPEKREFMLLEAGDITFHLAAKGLMPGLEGINYTRGRAILCYQQSRVVYVTLDPGIQTIEDFAGKRVSVGPMGATTFFSTMHALFEEYGIDGQVIESFMGWDAAKNALLDGLIDAAMVTTYWVTGGEYSHSPALEELIASPRDTYFVDYIPDMERFNKAMADADLPILAYEVPAEAFGPRQPNAFNAFSGPGGYWVDEAFPDEIAYELAKFSWEYDEEIQKVGGPARGYDKAIFTSFASKDLYHPGAVKFYQEMGVWPP